MRINLTTPFAEKDAVKKLGARWDAANKLWYIDNVTDLTPFLRWIPSLEAAKGQTPASAAPAGQRPSAKAPVDHFKAVVTLSDVAVPHCGCDVLPWNDCPHTAGQ